jgi:hypothetical protein
MATAADQVLSETDCAWLLPSESTFRFRPNCYALRQGQLQVPPGPFHTARISIVQFAILIRLDDPLDVLVRQLVLSLDTINTL